MHLRLAIKNFTDILVISKYLYILLFTLRRESIFIVLKL